ncbi:hypothetical protein [Pseudomonas sp. ICMP 10191]|uniref:hypothetical protein n=1 Tax=Pseudomonas sp. ICMP 10191 TaxID=1198294 RepID=UPI00072FFA04|nr:hypothetical protein [Pseudomonas sp. ICMP 10191]KTB97773.1 hypothetical protein AO388_26400 [Pseudomonas sp. ICMP 10191]
MDLSGVKHTVQLITHTSTGCPYCSVFQEGEKIAENINHLIQDHQGLLIHAGSETGQNYKGEVHHATCALVGFSAPPAPKELPKVRLNLNLPE